MSTRTCGRRKNALLVLLCAMSLWISGCSLLHLRQETETLYNSTIVVGIVTTAGTTPASPLVVAAVAASGKERTIVHSTVIHQPGPYELIVPQGQWQIVAFADANADLSWQQDEAIGIHMGGPLRIERTGGVMQDVNIVVRAAKPGEIDFPANTAVAQVKPGSPHFTSPGVVRALDDPLFSEDNGVKGFWRPLEFFREFGGNIYFVHPYDPKKIPILFVHGATGTPFGWQYLIDHIDLDRFQPWFYYYPSGASIKSMADLLFWKLINMRNNYPAQEIYLVAHSMGGLVLRSFLVDYGQMFPAIKKFISISTPWSGDELVENGLKYSPGVIPVWRDMEPHSEFAQSIYRKKLPPGIDHYLLFGHRGNRNPLRPNNDGVVTLATQLDPRAQTEARMVCGFAEDHSSILVSDKVAAQLATILAPAHDQGVAAHEAATGTLTVSFSRAGDATGDIWPELQLLPKNRGMADGYFLRLDTGQSGQALGPFPAGDYEVRVMVNGFRTSPMRQEVTIGPGLQPQLQVALAPSGSVTGMVHRQFYHDADPAGVYMPASREVHIRAIRLTGKGTDRTLTPLQTEGFDIFQQYQLGRDWGYGNAFAFYNLAPGAYTLTIEAEGHPAYSEQRMVEPGKPTPQRSIALP